MAVADMATQTLVKAKQYTSTVFLKLTRGLTQTEFLRRSRKIVGVCVAVWLAGNAVGYFIYRSTEDQTREEFYHLAATATRNLAQECRPLVLEKDVMMLNVAVRALEKNQAVAYGAIDAALTGSGGELTGSARARLEPFASAPLRALEAKLQGVDLAAFAAAPHTKLSIDAKLAPGEGAVLAGPVSVVNALAGPLDKERLPVASARGVVAIGKDRVRATGVSLVFAGGGEARGEASWAAGKLDAKLAVRDADLRSWQSTLRATRLAGNIEAHATAEAQSFSVALADPRFEIRGEARIAGGRLVVEKARVARGAAFVDTGRLIAHFSPEVRAGDSELELFWRAVQDSAEVYAEAVARLAQGEQLGMVQPGKGRLYQVKDRGLRHEQELAARLASGMLAGTALSRRVRWFADQTASGRNA